MPVYSKITELFNTNINNYKAQKIVILRGIIAVIFLFFICELFAINYLLPFVLSELYISLFSILL